jgi:hypothetical protein
MYCTVCYDTNFTIPPFCLCFTTHITFSADHGGRRLQPIPSPPDDAPAECAGITPTPWAMMPTLGFVSYHQGPELLSPPSPNDAFVGWSFLVRKFYTIP